jgi:hypothetical protein
MSGRKDPSNSAIEVPTKTGATAAGKVLVRAPSIHCVRVAMKILNDLFLGVETVFESFRLQLAFVNLSDRFFQNRAWVAKLLIAQFEELLLYQFDHE